MINAVIIYLQDDEHGNAQISVEVIGKPVESIELCDDLLNELMENPNAVYLPSSIFTRVLNQVQ
jgi:hypothetical protein